MQKNLKQEYIEELHENFNIQNLSLMDFTIELQDEFDHLKETDMLLERNTVEVSLP